MDADADVETLLTAHLDEVLVALNTGSFKGFTADLLLFHGDDVDAVGKFFDVGSTAANVVGAQLRVRHTTAEAALWVWLVLLEAIAAERTATHVGVCALNTKKWDKRISRKHKKEFEN